MLAIVLSRRDFRENDQIISFYTLEQGKLEVLARGVKKFLSKNAAFLEPFCFVDAEIIKGKELTHLGSAQPINIFKNIRADLQKSLAAGYAVALIDKIIHTGEKDKRMFELIKSWLEWLDSSALFNAMMLNAFIAKLLTLLGFDPSAHESNLEIKNILEKLVFGSWQSIAEIKYNADEANNIQKELYNFAIKHLERKIGNWIFA